MCVICMYATIPYSYSCGMVWYGIVQWYHTIAKGCKANTFHSGTPSWQRATESKTDRIGYFGKISNNFWKVAYSIEWIVNKITYASCRLFSRYKGLWVLFQKHTKFYNTKWDKARGDRKEIGRIQRITDDTLYLTPQHSRNNSYFIYSSE